MHHALKFRNSEEKINIWLDLCDFTFQLMKSSLPRAKLRERLKEIREAHLKEDQLILSKLARIK